MNFQDKNKIVTQDKDKNIILGDLVVSDKSGLKEVRDYLMCYRADLQNYDITTIKNLPSFRSVLPVGYQSEGNYLVHKYVDNTVHYDDEDQCDYTKETLRCNYLNSILIMTSLLGELDAREADFIAKQFIGNGIIYCSSLEKVWPVCSKDMYYNRKKNPNDLKVFLNLLKLNAICYEKSDEISIREANQLGFFKGFHSEDMEELKINSNLLLGRDSGFAKKRSNKG